MLDFFKKARYILTLMLLFTLCWFPLGLFHARNLICQLNDSTWNKVVMGCKAFNEELIPIAPTDANSSLDEISCIHNMVAANATSCIFHTGKDAENFPNMCVEILWSVEVYITAKLFLVPPKYSSLLPSNHH